MLLNDKRWYETAYRRAVIDMHIPDWDEKFLKVRSDVTIAPQTEIVLIPWSQIEAIGITDER